MKYVQINSYAIGWADSIIFKKHRELISQGVESYVFWGRRGGKSKEDDHCHRFATDFEVCLDGLLTRLNGRPGFYSWTNTARLLKALDEIDPDVVHLHCLVGYYINLKMLFEWLVSHRCQVIWTQHDCWSVTGHCLYFTAVNCNKWKCEECRNCPQQDTYPETLFKNREHLNFVEKRRLFTMLPADRMKLIVPSVWLKNVIAESFLSKYPVEVVYNTIDKTIFRKVPSEDVKRKLCPNGEFLVLGVASKWSRRKGLDDFIRLSKELDEKYKNQYKVFIVGASPEQVKALPKTMSGMGRTSNREELVRLYNAADVFFCPTKEDNYPTVNLEAEACGTPVITYNAGGSAETIHLPKSKAVENFEAAFVALIRLTQPRK